MYLVTLRIPLGLQINKALDRDAVVLMSVFLQFHYNSHFFSSVVLLFRWYCPPAAKSGNLPAFQLKHLDNLKFKNMEKEPLRL